MGTVLAIAVGEFVVRVAGLAPKIRPIRFSGEETVYQRSTNPLLAYELKPNYRNDRADCITAYPSTNRHGQRDVERELEKAPGATRILLLGDSIVEGYGICDLNDTLAGQWEASGADRGLEVLNFGVSGYNTLAEAELMRTKGVRFQPDQVLLVFTENDFDNFNREAFELAAARARPAAAEWLFSQSHLARLVFVRLNLFAFGAQNDPLAWNKAAMGDNNVPRGLAMLRELAQEHGFGLALAVWPRFTDNGVQDIHFLPGSDQRLVIEALAAAEGIPTLRLSRAFERDWEKRGTNGSPRTVYSVGDQMHPSPLGCGVAATALDQWLNDLTPPTATTKVAASQTPSSEAVQAARKLGHRRAGYATAAYNTGRQLEMRGDLAGAVAAYREAIKLDPDFAPAHGNLGVLLAQRGDMAEAERHLRRAVALKPDSFTGHVNLGTLLQSSGRIDDAIDEFERAIAIDPQAPEVRVALADCHAALGEFDRTAELLRAELALQPQSAFVNNRLAIALSQAGRIAEAVSFFEAALGLEPTNQALRQNLEMAREQLVQPRAPNAVPESTHE